MKKGDTKKIYAIMLLAAAIISMCSCTISEVHALDYSLEYDLYEYGDKTAQSVEGLEEDNNSESSDNKFNLTVEIKSEDGNLLRNARVTLYEDQLISYSAITDEEGIVSWIISGDDFVAKVECEGYVQEYLSIGLDSENTDVYEKITLKNKKTTSETEEKEIDMNELSTGNSEYKNLVAVRNEIYNTLIPIILGLEYDLNSIVTGYMEGEENVRIMQQIINSFENEQSSRDDSLSTYSFVQTDEISVGNWSDVLAVFLAKSGYKSEDISTLSDFSNVSFEGMEEVFWDMVSISVLQNENGADVLVNCLSYQDMAGEYFLSEECIVELEEMMQPDFQRLLASVTGNVATSFSESSETEMSMLDLGADVSEERKDVVETAYSLLDKVTYFWGGKYNEIGWNPGWGISRMVTSTGSVTTGTMRANGLDCSGYVAWVFANAFSSTSIYEDMGNDTYSQWYNSEALEWDKGMPGDLVFYDVPGKCDTNHVGIIVSVKEDGSYMVAHCTAHGNGVVITEAIETGFRYVRRPSVFGD